MYAIHDGHAEVHENVVEFAEGASDSLTPVEDFDGFRAVVHLVKFYVADLRQQQLEAHQKEGLVVDQQNIDRVQINFVLDLDELLFLLGPVVLQESLISLRVVRVALLHHLIHLHFVHLLDGLLVEHLIIQVIELLLFCVLVFDLRVADQFPRKGRIQGLYELLRNKPAAFQAFRLLLALG